MGPVRPSRPFVERVLDEVRLSRTPRRVVCLTEETVETLYAVGAGDVVVGVSRYVERPAEARAKPRVCAFVKADFAAIEALSPDLVLAFSDLQAEIAAECARRGLPVVVFNQRSVAEVLAAVEATGALVGKAAEARALSGALADGVRAAASRAEALPRRPRVHAEEWDEPLVTAIRWVAELVEVAGGDYLFPERALAHAAKERIVDPAEVARRDPEAIVASWCGKRVRPEAIAARPGWGETSAVREGRIHDVSPTILLQPGPAALTDGLRELERIVRSAAGGAPVRAA